MSAFGFIFSLSFRHEATGRHVEHSIGNIAGHGLGGSCPVVLRYIDRTASDPQHSGRRTGYQSHTAVFQQNVVYSVFRRQSHEQIRTFQKYFSQAMSSFMAKTVEPFTAGQSFPGKAGQGTGWHNAQKRLP